jgi:hypothetical protein
VTRCNTLEFTRKSSTWPPKPSLGFSEGEPSIGSVEEKMMDFLDGRTHGEELLHAIYDHVLDESIPERIRALFEKRENSAGAA